MRYSKNNPILPIYQWPGQRQEKGKRGEGYTGRIHSSKFKAKLIKLEWSVNGKRYSGDFCPA
jgi:hypothetical protein